METNSILLNNSDTFISVIYHLVKRSGLFHIYEAMLNGIVVESRSIFVTVKRWIEAIVEQSWFVGFKCASVGNESIAYGVRLVGQICRFIPADKPVPELFQ